MIKKIILILITSALILFTSCGTKIPKKITEKPQKINTIDYFPFIENIHMSYEGKGNEFAEKELYVDFIKDNKMQLRVKNPGTELVELYSISNGELKLISSYGEFYHRDDITNLAANRNELLLKEPLKKGTSWILLDGRKRYISGIDVNVKTPSGNYKALEVTTEGKDFILKDYYVLKIGHVKSVYTSNDYEVETSLKKIEYNIPLIQKIKVYYPDFSKNLLLYMEKEINLKTNEEIKGKLEYLLKNPPSSDLTPLISKNTKINSIKFNIEENIVNVDFSSEFVTEMNAGTTLEALILQGITNTLGDYYNSVKVSITIDGKPYSSGHIAMGPNEYFKVDYNSVSPYK